VNAGRGRLRLRQIGQLLAATPWFVVSPLLRPRLAAGTRAVCRDEQPTGSRTSAVVADHPLLRVPVEAHSNEITLHGDDDNHPAKLPANSR
jgi:hypothetical protein